MKLDEIVKDLVYTISEGQSVCINLSNDDLKELSENMTNPYWKSCFALQSIYQSEPFPLVMNKESFFGFFMKIRPALFSTRLWRKLRRASNFFIMGKI